MLMLCNTHFECLLFKQAFSLKLQKLHRKRPSSKMFIDYDKDVTVKPDYINLAAYKEIIQNALSLKEVEFVKVLCCMGSKTGENYCSFIYRAKIEFESKENTYNSLSVIIKSMPKSDAADFLESLDTFGKECKIYYDILPKLEHLFDNQKRFGPRIYHSIENPVNTLVFEDLSVTGFRMASREQGLDEPHARLILKRLAEFHASSMVLAEQQPALMKNITNGLVAPVALEKENGMLMRFFGSSANSMFKEVSEWPGFESIVPKLKKYISNLSKNLSSSQAPSPKDEIKVLNHGDVWVNNMLFQYDAHDKKPINVIFIDYQMSFFGSPGIDLNYFFYTSLQLELLKTKRFELLKVYHHALCAALELIGGAGLKPTLQQVLNEFERRASHGLFATFGILPTISMDKKMSDDSCLENYMDEEFTKRKIDLMFQSERVQNTLKFALKEFDKLGVWD